MKMKMMKLLALLLVLIMAVCLTACGGDKPASSQPSSSAPLSREDNNTPLNREDSTEISGSGGTSAVTYDPNMDLQSQIDSLNRNNLTPEQIAQLEADAAENGYEIEWNADGSMVIVESGSTLDMSGGWPDNEFTKDVPAPKVGEITATEITEFGCTIMVTWTAEDAKSYAEELKKGGFDKMTEEQDLAAMGVYTFIASNGEYTVTAGFTGGQGSIDIEETNPEDLAYWEGNPSDGGETSMTDDMQKQVEEAQKELEAAKKELEGMDLPEGYEDMLDGIDLNDLLNNLP